MSVSLKNTAYLLALSLLGTSTAHAANEDVSKTRTFLDAAKRVCGSEVAALNTNYRVLSDALAKELIAVDPGVPTDQHLAFDKYRAAVVVTNAQVGLLMQYATGLQDAKVEIEDLRNSNIAVLELSECLWPTSEDRGLIEQISATDADAREIPRETKNDDLFLVFDQADCMHWRDASHRILAIEPGTKDAKPLTMRVFEDTMGRCEEEAYK